MSRALRNRLDRISDALNSRKTSPPSIDVNLAKKLLGDIDRTNCLSLERNAARTVSQSTEDEMRELRGRIIEIARTITDKNYGALQAREDEHRVFKLSGKLTNAEIIERAQLRAKLFAYAESEEASGRSRIVELQHNLFIADLKGDRLKYGLSAEEQAELDRLLTRYPALPPDPNDPMAKAYEGWGKALEKFRSEQSRSATSRCRKND